MTNKELMENVRHTLVSLSGLKAIDKPVKSDVSEITVNTSDLIPLEFTDLIDRIDNNLDGDDSIDAFVLDNCIEWGNLITELSHKEAELNNIKAAYEQQEFDILYNSNINFKKLYGAANDKTRKHHVTVELSDLTEQKEELELSISYLKRRLSYLYSLVSVKTALLNAKERNDDV